jgi:hypothetical protein
MWKLISEKGPFAQIQTNKLNLMAEQHSSRGGIQLEYNSSALLSGITERCPVCNGSFSGRSTPNGRELHVNICLDRLQEKNSPYTITKDFSRSNSHVNQIHSHRSNWKQLNIIPFCSSVSRNMVKLDKVTEDSNSEAILSFEHQASTSMESQVLCPLPIENDKGGSDTPETSSEGDQLSHGKLNNLGIENPLFLEQQNGVSRSEIDMEDLNDQSPSTLSRNDQSNYIKTTKICPAYKRVPGTNFTVDAFRYGRIPGCKAYFLSHFHSDHYAGLNKRFTFGPIFCSYITASLAHYQLGISYEYLRPLPIGTVNEIDGVNVTLLDANHCPGSVSFLFEVQDLHHSRRYFHTGDFRANAVICHHPLLLNAPIDAVYLDTTYLKPSYIFPSQNEVLDFINGTVKMTVQECPETLILVGTYMIGKERVFLSIAESLNCKVFVDSTKRKILECLQDQSISSLLTIDCQESNLHVVPMTSMNLHVSRREFLTPSWIITHFPFLLKRYLEPNRLC